MKSKKAEVRQKWPGQLELNALSLLKKSDNTEFELTYDKFTIASLLNACNNRGEYHIGDKKGRVVHAVYSGEAYMGRCSPHTRGELVVLRSYLTFEEYCKLGKPARINLELVHTPAD